MFHLFLFSIFAVHLVDLQVGKVAAHYNNNNGRQRRSSRVHFDFIFIYNNRFLGNLYQIKQEWKKFGIINYINHYYYIIVIM